MFLFLFFSLSFFFSFFRSRYITFLFGGKGKPAIIRFHGLDMSNPSDRPWTEEDKVWILYPDMNLMLTKNSTLYSPRSSRKLEFLPAI